MRGAWPSGSASRITCSTTRARFREAVIDRFAESYLAGETPIPCVACNQHGQVRRPARHRAGARRRRAGDRALRASRRRCRTAGAALYRARRRRARPELFPVRDDAASSSTLCASRSADLPKAEMRALARELGLSVADKPDSQDICFVPQGRYTDVIARLKPGRRRAGRHRRMSTAACSAATRASSTTRSASAAASASPAGRAALRRAARCRTRAASSSARARRSPPSRSRSRDVNWLGDRPTRGRSPDGLEVAVRVRSTRPPRPALLRRAGAVRRGRAARRAEDGVAPGQACVFYDDATRRARACSAAASS